MEPPELLSSSSRGALAAIGLPLVDVAGKYSPLLLELSPGVTDLSRSLLPLRYIRPNLGSTGGACFHLLLSPSLSSSTRSTIQTPIWPLLPINGVQWIHRLRPSSSALGTHRTLAVTPRPWASAVVNSSRTRVEPPILFMNGDCSIPGTRREGDAKRMRREGYARMSRYWTRQQFLAS